MNNCSGGDIGRYSPPDPSASRSTGRLNKPQVKPAFLLPLLLFMLLHDAAAQFSSAVITAGGRSLEYRTSNSAIETIARDLSIRTYLLVDTMYIMLTIKNPVPRSIQGFLSELPHQAVQNFCRQQHPLCREIARRLRPLRPSSRFYAAPSPRVKIACWFFSARSYWRAMLSQTRSHRAYTEGSAMR